MVEYQRDKFVISTDSARLHLEAIYAFLSGSYWADKRPKEVVARSLQHSLCFGMYDGERQIGLARVISDYATYAYLCDVYVLEPYQGQGLGKWLMSVILARPDLETVWRWCLITRDAHGLYRQFGFSELQSPDCHMEYKPRYRPEIPGGEA